MIFVQTIIRTLDNSGARFVQCIKVLNKSLKKSANGGDIIVVSIKEIIPRIIYNKKRHLRKKKTLQKGEVHKSVIVCTHKKINRRNWHYINFSQNATVVLNKQDTPAGSRVLGPIFNEVRLKKHIKLTSLATYLI